MKILTGIYKNHTLSSPKGRKTRPTSSKMRGSIFNILQGEIEGAHFLDLFAGSGAMGLEALSRGAESATFVDNSREAIHSIRTNLRALDLKATVIQANAPSALKRLKEPFDIIYIDPPYDLDIHPLLEIIGDHLAHGGVILLEQRSKTPIKTPHLKQIDKRSFGDSTLYFFSNSD